MSRSLAACEGAVLVVDASQGIEAQTLANVYAALEADLEIIPVINKIDLPAADPELVRREIEDVIGLPGDGAVLASARQGIGIDEILEAVVARVPPPSGDVDAPLQALIFDSKYDVYRGVIIYVRVMQRRHPPGAAHPHDGHRQGLRRRRGRRVPPADDLDGLAEPGRGGLRRRLGEGRARQQGRRHRHRRGQPGAAPAARATGR